MSLPLLIEADQLLAQLENSSVLVIDCSSADNFAEAHIPGSVHLPPASLQCGIKPASGKLPSRESLSALLAGIGLTPDHHVVACDDEGGGWAGRLLWTLDCIGHQHYSLLNGGRVTWLNEGFPVASGAAATTPSDYVVDTFSDEPIATIESIMARLSNPDFAIWDARSRQEFEGSRVLAQRGGHIPGASHLEWTDLMDTTRNLRLLPAPQLQEALSQRGLTPDKHIVTHCQTHHRSGLTYFVGKLLGYPRIQAYDGSWSEWGNRDDTPVETA